MEITVSFGTIILLAIVFYFVIKTAVKNGINQSYLFSDKQRKICEQEELEATYKSMNMEVPDFFKEEVEIK